jgi:hypothetical protein
MVSGSNKVSVRVYPWHDLAWDLALADGMDPAQIESRFPKERCADVGEALHAAKLARDKRIRAMKKPKPISEKERLNLFQAINEEKHRHLDVMSQIIKDDENQWKESQSIQNDINTDIGTHLWRDILEGKVPVRKANGNPLRGESKQFQWRGPDTPHLTAAEGNEWLTKNRYLQVWEPGDFKKAKDGQNDSASASNGAAPVTNWRLRVQVEAYEHWLRLRASGCNPSVYSICGDMATWCVTNGIKGDKNQDPKAGTIRNTVLGAGHWTPPSHSVEQAKEYVAQTAQMKVARREM